MLQMWAIPVVCSQGMVRYNERSCGAILLCHNEGIQVVLDSFPTSNFYGKAIDLSMDHKPNYRYERKRIEKAGGQVRMDDIPKKVMADMKLGIHRIEGILHISRSIGIFFILFS